jgi:hypothetical protein
MRRVILGLLALVSVGCGPSGFVSDDFELSAGFETPEFRVRPITVADAEKDYEAVMESIDVIHSSFLDDSWPAESFTLDQNRRDLGAKERKFERRQSFTYTVVSPDDSRVLGCVYINKGINGPDAAVFMWARPSANDTGLDSRLEAAVRDWMKRDWPFEWVVFPGRTLSVVEPDPQSPREADSDPLLGAYWTGNVGADEFVFLFASAAQGYEVVVYSLNRGALKTEMPAKEVRVELPEVSLSFPTGAAYRGRLQAQGDTIDGQLFYGNDDGPQLHLERVADPLRYPMLPRLSTDPETEEGNHGPPEARRR